MDIKLDERLAEIADLVEGESVADIGCDHGKLGAKLLIDGVVKRVIASDISAPSLAKCVSLSIENDLTDCMSCRVGDGLQPFESKEVDTVVIAGMGGDEIAGILSDGFASGKSYDTFVLSPNTHSEKVRLALVKNGYQIVEDEMLECGGKFYFVIKAQNGKDNLDAYETLFGKFFRYDDVFKRYATEQIKALDAVISANPNAQRAKADKAVYQLVLKQCED